MALLEIRNLNKTYRQGDETITPLGGVHLNMDRGQFVSLMGASGTGAVGPIYFTI